MHVCHLLGPFLRLIGVRVRVRVTVTVRVGVRVRVRLRVKGWCRVGCRV